MWVYIHFFPLTLQDDFSEQNLDRIPNSKADMAINPILFFIKEGIT